MKSTMVKEKVQVPVAVVLTVLSIGLSLFAIFYSSQPASRVKSGSEVKMAAVSAIYYVDSSTGSDSNAGTSTDKPWKTVAKVNATALVAGDQVLFKRGGVWTETLTPKTSGTGASPITFGAYGTGNPPEFNGGGTATSTLRLDSKNYLTFTDLTFTNAKVSDEGSVYMMYGQGIKLQNLVVKNNGGIGISGLGTTNLTISNCDINNNNRQGIYLGYATGSLVEGNNVYANSKQKDDSFGIDIIVPTGGNIVRYNTVHDQAIITNSALFVCGSAKCGNGGIRFDGDNRSDISNTDRAGNQAYRNLIYNEDQGVQVVNFSSAEVFNNSISNTRQYGIVTMAQPGYGINSKNKIQNNTISAKSGTVILASLNGVSNTIDYNVYFPAGSNSFIWTTSTNWDTAGYSSLNFANWKIKSGLDAHSVNTDPKFSGAPSNLDLLSGSPAINNGTTLSAGVDFLKRAIVGTMDIGAYEYQGAVTSTCTESWSCGTWGTCTSGTQTRTCTDANSCGTTTSKPVTSQTCTVAAVCGNNVIEGAEACDGTSLNSQTCITKGFTGGTLKCTSCAFDTSACTSGCVNTCTGYYSYFGTKYYYTSCITAGKCCTKYKNLFGTTVTKCK